MWLTLVWVTLGMAAASAHAQPAARAASAQGSIAFLSRMMDQFHDRFPVYDDVSSAGNHFHTYAKIPNASAPVQINGSWEVGPHSGATAIRNELLGGPFGGFYFLNGVLGPAATQPAANFGTVPDAGIDLAGATSLSFWARGALGGERVEFLVAGVGRDAATGQPLPGTPHPGSSPVRRLAVVLSSTWQQYTVDVAGLDLSYVLGGFGWVASTADNGGSGIVFYLDDIQFNLTSQARQARLNEPRFLASFETLPQQSAPDPVGGFDLELRNTAFTYDNALALLAFLAEGSADSVRRARLIGDAFLYAAANDRTWTDGRIRDAYSAGDISLPAGWVPNGRVGTVPIPGFWDEAAQRFEERHQCAISVGNNAWIGLALLALYEETLDPKYLDATVTLSDFIDAFRDEGSSIPGFRGGLADGDNCQVETTNDLTTHRVLWSSSEHNLDVFALYSRLRGHLDEDRWREGAELAAAFIRAMEEPSLGCLRAGTTEPGQINRAAGQLAMDVQAWSLLALPELRFSMPELYACVEGNHTLNDAGFSGVDFNEDLDAVWFEGTGHLASALEWGARILEADSLRATLAQAQATPGFGDGSAIVATSQEALTTGFGFFFFKRHHIATAAWNVFAQLGWNPFWAQLAGQADADQDGVPDRSDNCPLIANADQRNANEGIDEDPSLTGFQTYGDACDADLDDDGIVAASDFFGVFRPCLSANLATTPSCGAADLDGDDVVGASDFFGHFRPALGSTPGPGALTPTP